jgi:hypothetical protein
MVFLKMDVKVKNSSVNTAKEIKFTFSLMLARNQIHIYIIQSFETLLMFRELSPVGWTLYYICKGEISSH